MVRPDASHPVAQLLIIAFQLFGSLLSSIDVLYGHQSATKAMTKKTGLQEVCHVCEKSCGCVPKRSLVDRIRLTGLLVISVAAIFDGFIVLDSTMVKSEPKNHRS